MLCVFLGRHFKSFTFLGVVKGKLNGFQWSLELISSSVDTLQGLCRASAKTLLEEQVRPHTLCVSNFYSSVLLHLESEQALGRESMGGRVVPSGFPQASGCV